jgi:hypothetical protein
MMIRIISLILLLSFLLAATSAQIAEGVDRDRGQFNIWFEQYASAFKKIRIENCSSQYEIYLYGKKTNITADWPTGGDQHNLFVQPLINCMLTATSPYILWQMQTAQIILGLTPPALAILGASSDELALLGVIGERNLLTLLLMAATPSVYTSRAFDYQDHRDILRGHEDRYRVYVGKKRRAVIVGLEYFFGLLSLANTAILSWELGQRTVCSIAPEVWFLPFLWWLSGVVVHIVGLCFFRLRVMRDLGFKDTVDLEKNADVHGWRWVIYTARRLLLKEIGLFSGEKPTPTYIKWVGERKVYIVGSWLHSIFTVMHIIFGTLVFSGLNFVGPRDALEILGRYMGSIILCRVVLMYELAVIRNRYNDGLKSRTGDPGCGDCQHLKHCDVCGGKRVKQASEKLCMREEVLVVQRDA